MKHSTAQTSLLRLALASTALAFAHTSIAHAAEPFRLNFNPVQEESTTAAATTEPTSAPIPQAFGSAGSFRLDTTAMLASNLNQTTLGLGSVAASWFVADGFSISLAAEGLYASQPEPDPGDSGGDVGGGGISTTLRWHFLREETWSLYAEFGINFTPRAFFGASFEIAEDTRLLTAIGWFHISNAQLGETNPAIDSLACYVGLSFGF